MKDKIAEKLDKHIEMLLEKPELTSEDYMILKERMREIRYEEEAEARKSEWEQKMQELTKLAFSFPGGGMGVH